MTTLQTPSPRSRKNPYKTNLILAAVLIVLGSTAYWFEYKKKPQMDKAAEAKTRLFPSEPTSEVESLAITDEDKKVDLKFDCKEHCKLNDPASHWEMSRPAPFAADAGNVGTFVNALVMGNVQESFSLDQGNAQAKLKEFGLSPETREKKKVSIKFKKNADPFTIYYGEKSAIGSNFYALITGNGLDANTIRIIPAHLFKMVDKDLTYWRDKRLLPYSSNQVESVRFNGPLGNYELIKEGKQWFLDNLKGKKTIADNEAVETFLSGLVFMQAHEYVSDDKNKERVKLGLPQKPHYTIRIVAHDANTTDPKAKSSLTLEGYEVLKTSQKKGDKQPKFYVTESGKNFVAEVERASAERFSKKQDSFRFRNLLTSAERQQVEKVKMKLENKSSYTFAKEGKNWSVDPKLENFDSHTVDKALTNLGAGRVEDFLDKAPIPRGNVELAEWTLFDKSGKEIRKILLYGTGPKGNFYVKISGGGANAELAKLTQVTGAAIPTKLTFFLKGK